MKHETRVVARRKTFDSGFVIISIVAIVGGIAVWTGKGETVFWRILADDMLFAAALLPKILGGVLVSSIIPLLLPREKVQQWIGPESGMRGLWAAAVAGAAIPGGPSVTLPLTVGLMLAGADLAAGITIVTSWALLSLNRTLIWELSFLPADLVVFRLVLSLVIPVALGLTVRKLNLQVNGRA